jgi:hypothetical protein
MSMALRKGRTRQPPCRIREEEEKEGRKGLDLGELIKGAGPAVNQEEGNDILVLGAISLHVGKVELEAINVGVVLGEEGIEGFLLGPPIVPSSFDAW